MSTRLALYASAVLLVPLTVVGLPAGAESQSSLRQDTLTVEHQHEPLGIDAPAPRFGWFNHTAGRDAHQAAYQIRVATTAGAVTTGRAYWDTGRVPSSASYEVKYAGPKLASTTRYFWSVRTWDGEGRRSAWAGTTWFETAFYEPLTGFAGTWIGRTASSLQQVPEPLLRKTFTVAPRVRSARLYVAGLGYYKAYLDGDRVGDHELDPGFTSYSNRVYYVTYDVTRQLRTGLNALGVRLGRGFYGDDGTVIASDDHNWQAAPWHSEPKLNLVLRIRYIDGKTTNIVSDTTWHTHDGPTTSELPGNETYDARLALPGWSSPRFNDATWSPAVTVSPPGANCDAAPGVRPTNLPIPCAGEAKLQAQPNEPIRVTARYQPLRVTKPTTATQVYEFPVMTAGWARITFRGTAGTQVKIRYAEKLNPDGTAPLGELSPQEDTYILRGGEDETYEPSYSYKGYKYVQVSATPRLPEIARVEGLQVTSDVPDSGAFSSSSVLLNAYDRAMRQTILNNLHAIPTDTPTYEKAGWTADAQLYADSAIRHFGMTNFYEKYTQDIDDAILPTGDVPSIVPPPLDLSYLLDPAWASAVILLHDDLYRYYGDTTALERDYSTMSQWMTAMKLQSPAGIFEGPVSYGDWSIPTNGGTQSAQIHGTAYVYRAATLMSDFAKALGKTSDAAEWAQFAVSVKTAYNVRFYNPALGAYYNSVLDNPPTGLGVSTISPTAFLQTSNLESLAWGLASSKPLLPVPTPLDHKSAAVFANLVTDIKDKGNHLSTGASGTKLILPVLTDNGQVELAYRVATNATYPGWGYWFRLGATSMWEDWTSTARSRNHAFLGTVDDWLFTRVAGLRPTAPAFRSIAFLPYPGGELTHAEAFQTTPLGVVATCWSKTARGGFALGVTVPVGSDGTVYFPATGSASVRESGTGKSVLATHAPGVSLVGSRNGRVALHVEAGTYSFSSGDAIGCTHPIDGATRRAVPGAGELSSKGRVPAETARGTDLVTITRTSLRRRRGDRRTHPDTDRCRCRR